MLRFVLSLSLVLSPCASGLAQQSARDIVDQVDRLLRGRSSRATVEMEVVTEHWSRTMAMEMWSLGTEYALIRIASPRKDAGMATLKAGPDIWNYLPRVDRTIKLPPSLMGAAWMGSHFTNDDLVKESRIIDDYDIEITFDGVRGGVRVWEFALTPKAEAAVVWGRIEEEIRQDDLMPVWARYYAEDGTLMRTMTFEDVRTMGGRLVPTLMHIVPADKPAERTTIRYRALQFDVELDQSFFSLRRLRDQRVGG
ncbi:MAG TPA: outer membrane lipoprotein-sorting protein [Gemmatimonadales bacterium]|jgi:outer membrane lipoprotein-sorting protein